MSVDQFFALAAQAGPLGLLVAYLVWRENCDRKERREQATDRARIDEADTVAREKLASSLTALSMVIQGRPHV